MTRRQPPVVAVLLSTALVLAACGGSSAPATGSEPAANAATDPATAHATEWASAEPAGDATPPGAEGAGAGSGAPASDCDPAAVAARLPTALDGATLTGMQVSRAERTLSISDNLRAALDGIDRSGDDLCGATAVTPDYTVTYFAYRLPGADAGAMERFYVDWVTADSQLLNPGATTAVTTERVELAGRPATRITVEGAVARKYAFADGDIVFAVQADTDEIADRAIAAMP